MRKSRFTEAQIIGMIKEQEAGIPTAEVCRRHGLSPATFYKLMDLSRICAAPLTTYRVAKENTDGITTDRGIPRRSIEPHRVCRRLQLLSRMKPQ